MTFGRIRAEPEEAIFDRSYRLRKSRTQVRVDQASIVGAVFGAAIAFGRTYNPVFGGVTGLSVGIIGMSIYNGKHFLEL